MEKVKALWDKFITLVKSAPVVYALGVGTGILVGWVL